MVAHGSAHGKHRRILKIKRKLFNGKFHLFSCFFSAPATTRQVITCRQSPIRSSSETKKISAFSFAASTRTPALVFLGMFTAACRRLWEDKSWRDSRALTVYVKTYCFHNCDWQIYRSRWKSGKKLVGSVESSFGIEWFLFANTWDVGVMWKVVKNQKIHLKFTFNSNAKIVPFETWNWSIG